LIKRLTACVGAIVLASATCLTPALAARPHAAVSLVGAGSTFDFPFFDRAFKVYEKSHSVSINYQPVGSGTGIAQFIAKTVDFGASDVPMDPTSDLQKAQAAGGPVQQIAVTLGGVAIIYHVPGVKTGLRLSGSVLADIYDGGVQKWNDKEIRKLNPKVGLPNLQITPVHRADSSGTTYAFTDYLSKVDDVWRGKVGVGKSVNWPVGVGQQGTQGVAQTVKSTGGAIGYAELAYALQNHLTYAAIKNQSGKYVTPSPSSVAADARAFPTVSARHFSIANGKGAKSYPIATYSWVLMYQHQPDKAKGKALVSLMSWMLGAGQKYAKQLDYVPLPKVISGLGTKQLKTVK
jgi:phosphate transport system substrate-binding protein